MPLQKLQFRPGVNRESTSLANEGGWFECDKIRFRSGSPEKIGGWIVDTGVVPVTSSPNLPLRPPSATFWGICRSLWNWVTLAGYNLLGLGTNLKFYIQQSENGSFYDVTPLRTTTLAGAVTFAATAGSSTITVTNASHSAVAGDFVTFSGAASLGGAITANVLNQEYQVLAVLTNNTYTITARNNTTGVAVNATGSDSGTGGGSTVAAYQINTGSATNTTATGWGAGGWGGSTGPSLSTTLSSGITPTSLTIPVNSVAGFAASGTILIDSEVITYTSVTVGPPSSFNLSTLADRGAGGTAVAHSSGASVYQFPTTATGWGASASTGVAVALRLWSQTNYGQDLIFNVSGGPMYYWAVNTTPTVYDRGQLMYAGGTVSIRGSSVTCDTTTPSAVNFIMVSDASRFLIAFGCNDPTGVYATTTFNPMQIRWTDQEAFNTWKPSTTNQAGDYLLSHGSTVVTAIQTRQEILVLTDAAIYSMQFLGAPLVWGFQILGDNISIVGPNAIATANNVTYWMGTDKFYMYSGRVETLPCALRQYVYEDINLGQGEQVYAGTNEGYSEIWWFYCSITGPFGTGTPGSPNTIVDRYVVYNHLERTWYYGTMQRTAWLDSSLRDYPLATGYGLCNFTGSISGTTLTVTAVASGNLMVGSTLFGTNVPTNMTITALGSGTGGVGTYTVSTTATIASQAMIGVSTTATQGGIVVYHENGVDDGTTNPVSGISAYVQSSDFDIGDGHNYGFVWRLIPDVTFDGSESTAPSVQFTVLPRANPGANYGYSNDPIVTSANSYQNQRSYNVQQFTQQIYVRVRGRQMAFKVSSSEVGVQWQHGATRIDARADGRR